MKPQSEKPKSPKATASFKIDPILFEKAKEKCWKQRTTFSSQVEALVKEWAEKK